ncbi:hypothetical protein DYBT9275_02795 [Dyadobacter sp. CECT 9275]|uniref:Blue (type 1) copper domain-containing protein n=1 Tax=Dyadobacter helix TaxID=2822344 RepID=A0A916N668_9BACT|nr:plastocyanin/azurin family copper-binding protein [Dyadobacter sp. CECT 9275]CAG5002051.1 hypothetical protein DYBT9275_02795 [Dyadobacter sp. CECT 9275]
MPKPKIYFLPFIFILLFSEICLAQTDPETVITIKAIAGLQFDLVRFKVKPGAPVKLIFTNTDDMSHNLVISQPGSREEIVNLALELGDRGPAMNFVPETPKILWSLPVLAPEETKTITFTAPKNPGVYPYACTYPGHGFVMYGAMYVTTDEMPAIQRDLHIPETRRTVANATSSSDHNHSTRPRSDSLKKQHPYRLIAPYIHRVFIENAGPAAIAVHLPQQLSYCWDAGACRLRFAWEGEFLDNTAFWKGHKDADVKILGNIFYQDKTLFPLRLGNEKSIPVVKFKGYSLINRYPEFHYTLNGVDVYELILPKKDGSGLVRTFRIPKVSGPVWFAFNEDDGITYSTIKGEQQKGKIKLSAAQATRFTITMTKRKDSKL